MSGVLGVAAFDVVREQSRQDRKAAGGALPACWRLLDITYYTLPSAALKLKLKARAATVMLAYYHPSMTLNHHSTTLKPSFEAN